jgi:hypothetical protein
MIGERPRLSEIPSGVITVSGSSSPQLAGSPALRSSSLLRTRVCSGCRKAGTEELHHMALQVPRAFGS